MMGSSASGTDLAAARRGRILRCSFHDTLEIGWCAVEVQRRCRLSHGRIEPHQFGSEFGGTRRGQRQVVEGG
jgi:hypothetical protein